MNDRVLGRYFYCFNLGEKPPATFGSLENDLIWIVVARTQQFMSTLRDSSKHHGTAPSRWKKFHQPSYELIRACKRWIESYWASVDADSTTFRLADFTPPNLYLTTW